mmetsp:Transcript_33785/g.92656  ORF Transcript_33785/g.92656 Transcript_33785/m.92656 type:complete len:101 (+) Transcript_33785:574-876(+)
MRRQTWRRRRRDSGGGSGESGGGSGGGGSDCAERMRLMGGVYGGYAGGVDGWWHLVAPPECVWVAMHECLQGHTLGGVRCTVIAEAGANRRGTRTAPRAC